MKKEPSRIVKFIQDNLVLCALIVLAIVTAAV